jgi:hypothetical protein
MELGPEQELKRQKRFSKIDDVDDEFRDQVQGMGKDQLRQKITEVVMLEQANQDALKADQKVASIKEELKNLTEPYKEDAKIHKLKLEFLAYVAESKGYQS